MSTPATRARSRRHPAIPLPPKPPRRDRDLDNLRIWINGRGYRIGRRLRRDSSELELTMEGASQLRLSLADPDGRMARLLTDPSQRLWDGVRVNLDGVDYMLAEGGVTTDEDGNMTLTLEDEVAWRLRQFSRYFAKTRKKVTRAEFVQLLIDEASAAPRQRMRSYIPELTDRQPIAGKG